MSACITSFPEFSVSFYIKAYDSDEGTAEQVIREKVDSFFSHIRQGEFAVYDAYNGIGRLQEKVRYAGYTEEEFKKKSIRKGNLQPYIQGQ